MKISRQLFRRQKPLPFRLHGSMRSSLEKRLARGITCKWGFPTFSLFLSYNFTPQSYSRYSSHLMKGVAIDMVNVHTTRSLEPTSTTREETSQGASPLPNRKPQSPQHAVNVGHLIHPAEQPALSKQPTSPLGRAIDRLLDTAGKPGSSRDAGQGVAGLQLHLIA